MTNPTATKDLNYYLDLRYKIELIPQDDGSWGAIIPDLPGCVGGGDSIAEALAMLEDAKLAWLTSRLKHSDTIPEPSFSITNSAA
jgi:antitoxin HicB